MLKRVLMVGPDRSVQGGISGVVNNYYEVGLDKQIRLKYIGTMVDGSKFQKLIKATLSYMQFAACVRKYDIVHVNMAADASYYRKLYFIKLAKLFHKKLVIHQHGGDVENFFDKNAKGKRRERMYKTLNQADKFIVLAPIWKEFFGNILPREKIVVLPNGITLPEYSLQDKDYTNYDIVFVGRLCKEKGIRELFAAVECLQDKYPNIHLYLGGKWEDDALQEQQKRMQENVIYLGWLDSAGKRDILSRCSIFVMPSYFEGQCIAVLEAMAYGCATIATRVGGLQQTFTDGEDGILVAPKETEGLRNALEHLLTNIEEKKRMGIAGREKIQMQFDIEVIKKKLVDLYQTI